MKSYCKQQNQLPTPYFLKHFEENIRSKTQQLKTILLSETSDQSFQSFLEEKLERYELPLKTSSIGSKKRT